MEKILEIQRRFFRKEKNQFLDAVEEKLTEYGYEFERKSLGSIVKSVNLETKNDNPDFIFIAHYDTGVTMPFWVHGLFKLFGVNSIASIIVIAIFVVTLNMISSFFPATVSFLGVTFHINWYYIIMFILLFQMLIPNKKNFDDNTSGVIALLELAKKIKENGIDNVKFIFVDNEEWGLLGSKAHKKYLEKEQLISSHCKVISIDCVGGSGKIPLIVRNDESEYADFFQKEIQKEFELCKSDEMLFPFSDNYSFKNYGALNISFVERAKIPVGYYVANVHTSKDKEIDLPKIEKLTDVLTNAIKNI